MKATLTEEQKKFIHEMVMKASKGSAEEQEFVIALFGEQLLLALYGENDMIRLFSKANNGRTEAIYKKKLNAKDVKVHTTWIEGKPYQISIIKK